MFKRNSLFVTHHFEGFDRSGREMSFLRSGLCRSLLRTASMYTHLSHILGGANCFSKQKRLFLNTGRWASREENKLWMSREHADNLTFVYDTGGSSVSDSISRELDNPAHGPKCKLWWQRCCCWLSSSGDTAVLVWLHTTAASWWPQVKPSRPLRFDDSEEECVELVSLSEHTETVFSYRCVCVREQKKPRAIKSRAAGI